MKPTRERIAAWVKKSCIATYGLGYTAWEGQLERFAELAYQAGLEQGRADYEREHLRHTVPLPDALKAMQEQVAEACAKVCDDLADCEQNTDAYRAGAHWCREIIRSGEWRKYMDGKP